MAPSAVPVLMDLHTLVIRVRAEFNEMPGLRLTMQEAQRLWGIERAACESVVDALVRVSFLRRGQDGTIVRAA